MNDKTVHEKDYEVILAAHDYTMLTKPFKKSNWLMTALKRLKRYVIGPCINLLPLPGVKPGDVVKIRVELLSNEGSENYIHWRYVLEELAAMASVIIFAAAVVWLLVSVFL